MKRISNEDGYKTHVVIGATTDNKMFRTEFHTSGNSGVKLPDYYKGVKSTLSKNRHLLVASISNFLVWVQNHIKVRYGGTFKKVYITDMNNRKIHEIFVNFEFSRSQYFEWVNEKLPRKFRPNVYRCHVEGRPETWLEVSID